MVPIRLYENPFVPAATVFQKIFIDSSNVFQHQGLYFWDQHFIFTPFTNLVFSFCMVFPIIFLVSLNIICILERIVEQQGTRNTV